MSRRAHRGGRRSVRGFSLLEILIALLVLAFGLLGLGLLQTMNLRFTKSADQRTQAVNLASDMLDMMRANRSQLSAYAMDASAFGSVTVPAGTGCVFNAALSAAENVSKWQCQVREALGPEATAVVVVNDPAVRVTINWSDAVMTAGGTPEASSVVLESSL
jgi:type IV pilus assembly protein PilV